MLCEKSKECPLYNYEMMKTSEGNETPMLAMYKKKYCEGDNSECARYVVLQECGSEHVPLDLFPNMTKKAEEIIASFKNKE